MVKDIKVRLGDGFTQGDSECGILDFFLTIAPWLEGRGGQPKTHGETMFSSMIRHPGLYQLNKFGEEEYVGRGLFRFEIEILTAGQNTFDELSEAIAPEKIPLSHLAPKIHVQFKKELGNGHEHTITGVFDTEGMLEDPYFTFQDTTVFEVSPETIWSIPVDRQVFKPMLNYAIEKLGVDIERAVGWTGQGV